MLTSPFRIVLVGSAVICVGLSLITKSQVRPVPSSASSFPSPAPSPAPSASPVQEFQSNQVVVELKPGASIDDVNGRNGTTTTGQISGTSYYLVSAVAQAAPVGEMSAQRRSSAVVVPTPLPTATDTSTEELR